MDKHKAKLLVIDDEERIRSLLRDYLEDLEEFQIGLSDSAEAALASLEQEPADLCIVDIRLPAMNGLSFISKAAERGLCKHFLVHTGSTDFHIDETLLKLNLSEADVFLKPCNLDDMLKRIREVLKLPGD